MAHKNGIRFTTPIIHPGVDEKSVYGDLKQYFSSFSQPDKLFLKYNDGYGIVYYPTKDICKVVINAVLANNIHSIVFEHIIDKGNDCMQGKSFQNNRTKGIIAEVTKTISDANGDVLSLLENPNTSHQFVNLKDANKCGYQIYDSPEVARRVVISDLKDYLMSQAEVFMKLRSLRYDIRTDLAINVQWKHSSPSQINNTPVNNKARESDGNIAKPKPKELFNSAKTDVSKTNGLQNSPSQNIPVKNGNSPGSKTVSKMSPSIQQAMPTKANKENYISNTSLNSDTSTKSRNSLTPRQLLSSLRKASKQSSNASISKSPILHSIKQMKLDKYPPGFAFVANMAGNKEEAHLQILHLLTATSFIAYVLSNKALEFESLADSLNMDTIILTPSVGDYVFVKYDTEKLSRAFVLELKDDKYKVALVDYATVIEVDTVYEAPKELSQEIFDEFTCICEAPAEYVKELTVDDTKLVLCKENNTFIDSNTKGEIKCERWIPEEFRTKTCNVPTPEPKSAQKIYTSLPTDEVPVQLNDVLSLTGFEAGVLYLRSKDMHSKVIKMNKESQQAERLEKPVKIGQYLLCKTNKTNNEEWRRCLVKSITNKGILVEYIDYFKSVEMLSNTDLFNISKETVFGPTLIKRRLRNFEDKEYSEKALAKIIELTKKKFTICYLQDDIIDLKLIDNDIKPLSEMLVELDMPPVKLISDLKLSSISLDGQLKIVILHVEDDNSFYFGASTISTEILAKLDLDYMENEPSVENIVEGQLCVALFEGGWFRGEVKKVDDSKATVYFIDFGNTDVIDTELIKPFPDDMLEIAACALKGILTPDSSVRADPVAGELYHVIIKKKDEEMHHVEVLDIVELE